MYFCLLPAFDGLTVEDITTDDVQRLFNGMNGSKATTPIAWSKCAFQFKSGWQLHKIRLNHLVCAAFTLLYNF